jgi:hypothetical protein
MVFTYLETAIAFTLVILAASLMVNVIVRILDAMTHARARGVQAMLRQLYRGYLREAKQSAPIGGANRFLHDVLSAPILHSEASYDALHEARASVDKLLDENDAKTAAQLPALHSSVEYLLENDLLDIIRQLPEEDVRSWFDDLAQADAAAVATRRNDFVAYIDKWFTTAAATASNQYGRSTRRKAMSVSAIVVVALNLDAIRLAYDLYRGRALDARLAQHVDDMTAMAQRLLPKDHPDGAPSGPTGDDTAQLEADLQKTMALFSVERVPLGWNDAYITKRWCKFHDDCDDATIAKPTRSQMMLDAMYWLLGLFAAWLMLSLGAPFWVKVLETFTGIRDRLKPPPGKAPGSSPWSDDSGDGATTTIAASTTTTPLGTKTEVAAVTAGPAAPKPP